MKLVHKTTILFLSAFLILLLAIIVTSHLIIKKSFDELEKKDITEKVLLLEEALKTMFEPYQMFVKDWGIWEDTFNFVKNPSQSYVEKNLTIDVFANIQMDFLAFFDVNAKLVYYATYDKENRRVLLNTIDKYACLWQENSSVIQKMLQKQPFSGFVKINNDLSLVMITAHPIYKNNTSEEYAGTFMIGGALTTNFVAKLTSLVKQPIELNTYMKQKRHHPKNIQKYNTTKINDSLLQLSLLIPDISGQPLFWIKTTIPRPFNQQAKKTLNFMLAIFIGSGIVFFGLFLFLIRSFMIKRLVESIEQIKQMAKTPDDLKELPIETKDEVGELKNAFNVLIRAVKEKTEMLQENENYQRTLFNGINIGILIVEPKNHMILFANKVAQNLIGLSQDEICWRICHNFICPTEKGNCPIVDLHQDTHLGERILLNSKKECIPVLKYAAIVKWKGQEFIVESFVDIRKQKEAEETIRLLTELEQTTRTISSNFLKVSFSNLETTIIEALEKIKTVFHADCTFLFEKQSAISNENLYEVPTSNVISSQNINFYKKLIAELEFCKDMLVYNKMDKKISLREELLQLIRKRDISSLVVIPLIYKNSIFGMLGLYSLYDQKIWKEDELNALNILAEVFSNALQRLYIEKELKNSEECYRKVFYNSAAPAILFNKNGIIELANNEFVKLVGLPLEEIVRHNIKNFFDAKEAELLMLDTKEITTHPITFLTKNGERKLLASHSSLPESNSIIVSFVDLTERYLMEQKLKEAKKSAEEANIMKINFLANMSHEIRTPLNTIVGFADLIHSATTLAEAKQNARDILRESENLLALITDILDTAKIEAGKMTIETLPFSLKNLINEIEPAIRLRAESKKLEFNINYDEQIPPVILGDPIRLRQILLKLLTNAVKFTEKGKVILSISLLSKENDSCVIKYEISDTGIGIPTNKQKDIFMPFSQADSSIKRKYTGSGLGVYLASHFVKLMGGNLQLESKVGVGTTFSFELKSSCSDKSLNEIETKLTWHETGKIDKKSTSQNLKIKPSVLIVEDYQPNQEVLRRELEQIGAVPHIASNGIQALSAVSSQVFDLILMDLQMPEMSGYEVAHKIRCGKSPNVTTPIIALTADAHSYVLEKIKEAGMNDVIHKPVRLQHLASIFEKWIQNYSPYAPVEQNSFNQKFITENEKNNKSILDFDQISREFGGNKTLLKEVLSAFLTTLKKQLVDIHTNFQNENIEFVRKEAHKIRGAAANLAIQSLAKKAALIEEYCSSEYPEKAKIASLLSELEIEYRRFAEELSKIK